MILTDVMTPQQMLSDVPSVNDGRTRKEKITTIRLATKKLNEYLCSQVCEETLKNIGHKDFLWKARNHFAKWLMRFRDYPHKNDVWMDFAFAWSYSRYYINFRRAHDIRTWNRDELISNESYRDVASDEKRKCLDEAIALYEQLKIETNKTKQKEVRI